MIVTETTVSPETFRIYRNGPRHFKVVVLVGDQVQGWRDAQSLKQAKHIMNLWMEWGRNHPYKKAS